MTIASPAKLPPTIRRTYEIVGHWATRTPTAPAVGDGRRMLSYAKLADAIEHTAAALRERGVRPGDRVAIVTENNVTATVLMFATQRLEAWPAMINARIGAHEIEALEQCAAVRLTLFALDGSPASHKLAEARAGAEPFTEIDIGDLWITPATATHTEPVHSAPSEQVALLLFTSGTTGRSKAVMLSHAGLLQLGAILSASRRTTAADAYNGLSPLSHIMGQSNLWCALSCGASVQLMPRLEVPVLARSIARGEMTHLSFVPTVYARLLDYASARNIALRPNRLSYISSGGAPLDPLLKERVETALGLPLVNGYGMTEFAPAVRTRQEIASPAASIGWPEAGVEARIVASDGGTCTSDQVGELWLRSATRMLGYYRNPEETAVALRPEGWFATGDLAHWLPDGQIAVVGRKKEMIIRSGFNVYPAEVEAALNRLPQVLQSGVVGRQSDDGNEEVIAFVQLRPGETADATALLEQLRPLIAPYKRPQHIVILDALPVVSTGKIWKAKLAELARALPSVQVNLPGELVVEANTLQTTRRSMVERWYREGYYRAETLSQAFDRAAREHPHNPLHFHVGRSATTLTTGEIVARGRQLAGALYELGMRKGDVFAVQMPTRPETALLYIAAFHAGAILIPIVHTYGPAELGFILRTSRARWFAMPDRSGHIDFVERLANVGELPDLQRTIVLGERLPPNGVSYDELVQRGTADFPTPVQQADEVCVLLYTSGTTAAPKGVQQTHNTIRSEWNIPFFPDSGPYLNPFPAGHIAGFNFLLRPMICGVPMVLMDQWDAEFAAELVERYRVTQGGGTPFFLLSLLDAAQRHGRDFSSLSSYGIGATTVSPEHVMLLERHGIRGGRGYGLTEHSTASQFKLDAPVEIRANTDGKLQPGTEVRIVDETGRDLPRGTEGEILLLGPELFAGYTDPALNAECFTADGWFRTGDIGRLDAENYLTITDRKKDIIIRGGENISSREVEGVLLRHPAVLETAVVAMPDPRYGERVCAFVMPQAGRSLSFEELIAHFANSGIDKHKTPERLIVVSEFPRTPSGKIKKAELRKSLRDQ